MLFLAALPLALPLLWLLVIRPYCIRHGKGYTPGASLNVTLWIDWQEAGEIARAKGHSGMRVVCGAVFCMQVVIYLFLALGLLVEILMEQAN